MTMRGDITIKILEGLKDAAVGAADLLTAFLSVPYGSSIRRFEYELAKQERQRERKLEKRRLHHRYHAMVHRLKQQGLIKEEPRGRTIFLRITKAGKEKLSILRKKSKEPLPSARYSEEAGERRFVIIAFDIPEHSKRKRNWLRSALRHMGMRMIQKSVWAGKVKVPKAFLVDLEDQRLIEYVEIFEVNKSGSLREM